jgi:zinc finger HIT domain-containing protein 3
MQGFTATSQCTESLAESEPTPSLDGNQVASLHTEPKPQLLSEEEQIPDAPTLKPLTSLRWPYIPEEPSYADPLKRDEPMPLQLRHYQDIGL